MRRFIYLLFLLVPAFACTQIIHPANYSQRIKLKAPGKFPGIIPDTIYPGAFHNFRNYSVREGLAQSQINKVFIDSRNILWVGTYGGGISVYDGTSFKNLN